MTEPEPEPWPFGSGTEADPYVVPPGVTLDTTEEEMQAIIAAGQESAS